MIALTEDIYVRQDHISSIVWRAPGECLVSLLNGLSFELKGGDASNAWLLLTEGEA